MPENSTQGCPVTNDIAFVWAQLAPYHVDRCEAVAKAHAGDVIVYGIQIASTSQEYAWSEARPSNYFRMVTLCAGVSREDAGALRRLWALIRNLPKYKCRHVFLCNYNEPETLLVAALLRAMGRRVYLMCDSKFDDRPRYLWREALKSLWLLPYNGFLASGKRAAAYLRFLGVRTRMIALGYDTVSVERIRTLARSAPAPGGVSYQDREFVVVARLLAKKNIGAVLAAYERYRQRTTSVPRSLIICGAGPLEASLRHDVESRNLTGVQFTGFLQDADIARVLARGLALLLCSVEEQWGLVVNEALAMGVPLLVSDNVGARDTLVRVGINGYVIEPDNVDGLARLMNRLATDHAEWKTLAQGAMDIAEQGDVARFVEGIAALTGIQPAMTAKHI